MILLRQKQYSKSKNTILGLTALGLATGTIAGNAIEARKAKSKAIKEFDYNKYKENVKRLEKQTDEELISDLVKDGYSKKEAREIAKNRYNPWRDEKEGLEKLKEKAGKEASRNSWTSANSKGRNIGAGIGSAVGLSSGLLIAKKLLKK